MHSTDLEKLAKLIRYYILTSTTEAGSGHPTSSLSGTELMTSLFFDGYFRADLEKPQGEENDRLIFSKGHAAPLLYSMYTVAGALPEEELMTLRKFGSPIEGHPTMDWPYTQVATGSLGQGLGVGVGMALSAKKKNLDYKTYVLLGDSEIAEGSVWEAIQIAAEYELDNLIGIIDVNRLGQRGETMYGHSAEAIAKRVAAFDWETVVIDGHNLEEVKEAYEKATKSNKPFMIIAQTNKGEGVSFLSDKDDWHGKPLNKEQLSEALAELGEIEKELVGKFKPAAPTPLNQDLPVAKKETLTPPYKLGEEHATREVYGEALTQVGEINPKVAVLDAETSNSTYANKFKQDYPDRFFEMFIAEQNMVSVGLGLARSGWVPFCSSFAAFLARAFDQIRCLPYSEGNVKVVGSHAGVSIGQDGSSQMGLEDLAMTRTVEGSVVLYPSEAVSAFRLVEEMAKHDGFCYLRTTRGKTPVLYSENEKFPIGGSKTVKSSNNDEITVIGAGITLAESMKAYQELQKDGINIRVIDLYSVKPVDKETLEKAAKETKALITVEDHHREGGLFSAVAESLAENSTPIHSLAVTKTPHSGAPEELLRDQEIDAEAIIKKVKELI